MTTDQKEEPNKSVSPDADEIFNNIDMDRFADIAKELLFDAIVFAEVLRGKMQRNSSYEPRQPLAKLKDGITAISKKSLEDFNDYLYKYLLKEVQKKNEYSSVLVMMFGHLENVNKFIRPNTIQYLMDQPSIRTIAHPSDTYALLAKNGQKLDFWKQQPAYQRIVDNIRTSTYRAAEIALAKFETPEMIEHLQEEIDREQLLLQQERQEQEKEKIEREQLELMKKNGEIEGIR
ncbi:MAG: hypothetical protein EZS28_000605 [Streblomastix strix]|uniref:Uncharacterized protein n=1 Tax=Streblomastix strix TaxID=222440 RepID=A0A5J4X9Q3_9EUKA|nr:MAG: hypothetical protein EZS28_000605 [Streblomastix strix]